MCLWFQNSQLCCVCEEVVHTCSGVPTFLSSPTTRYICSTTVVYRVKRYSYKTVRPEYFPTQGVWHNDMRKTENCVRWTQGCWSQILPCMEGRQILYDAVLRQAGRRRTELSKRHRKSLSEDSGEGQAPRRGGLGMFTRIVYVYSHFKAYIFN